jgi:oligopeptide/dipeptide ABC transporter ATP-binding protein
MDMPGAGPLLETRDLRTHFRRGGWLRPTRWLRAVDGVSLSVARQETLGLVGESGSGKTTLGRTILRLVEPTGGEVHLGGQEITRLSQAALRPVRRRMQIVFQNPYASLNPRRRVAAIVGQPLAVHRVPGDHVRMVGDLLERVGLPPGAARRYPHEFSGGQRQRIAIARALALRPDLVVADEITSGLDVTVKLRVLALLRELQVEFHVAYLFISHDLGVFRHISHDVLVMYLGLAMEQGPKERIFTRPRHPYTQALLASTPGISAAERRHRIPLKGERPSPLAPPAGCVFSTRCPHAIDRCRAERPALRPVDGRRVSCHLAEQFLSPERPEADARDLHAPEPPREESHP